MNFENLLQNIHETMDKETVKIFSKADIAGFLLWLFLMFHFTIVMLSCFVVTCWERTDLLALLFCRGVYSFRLSVCMLVCTSFRYVHGIYDKVLVKVFAVMYQKTFIFGP